MVTPIQVSSRATHNLPNRTKYRKEVTVLQDPVSLHQIIDFTGGGYVSFQFAKSLYDSVLYVWTVS